MMSNKVIIYFDPFGLPTVRRSSWTNGYHWLGGRHKIISGSNVLGIEEICLEEF